MRNLLLATMISVFSFSAFASVDLSIRPNRPIVMTADGVDSHGNKITGPWFDVEIMIMNSTTEPITLTTLAMMVAATDGTENNMIVSFGSPGHVVAPGVAATLIVTMEQLPPTVNSVYNGDVVVTGYMGEESNPGPTFTETLTFQTQ